MDVFTKHKKRIARKTLKLSDVGASILGGMTKEQARQVLGKKESDYIEREDSNG